MKACGNVSAELRQNHPEMPWRAAASLRNRVIHGYFDIDFDVVWAAAELEVPALANGVRAITGELDNES